MGAGGGGGGGVRAVLLPIHSTHKGENVLYNRHLIRKPLTGCPLPLQWRPESQQQLMSQLSQPGGDNPHHPHFQDPVIPGYFQMLEHTPLSSSSEALKMAFFLVFLYLISSSSLTHF